MVQECDKCHRYGYKSVNYLLEGALYLFCERCVKELEELDSYEKKLEYVKVQPESKLVSNIREARKKREKNESPWSSIY
jgi:hypothetical protein